MTVKELREFLARLPDDTRVVMSSDAEGNGYSPLSEVYQGRYLATRPWKGEFRTGAGEGEKAVCLWPLN